MDTQYYARSENDAGEKELVSHHLSRSAQLCEEFLTPLGYGHWGTILGSMHDFGKFSDAFQQVLRHEATHVNHAFPGAAVALNLYGQRAKIAAQLLSTVIASHHSHLDYNCIQTLRRILTGQGQPFDSSGKTISLFGRVQLSAGLALWQKNFSPVRLTPGVPDFSSAEDPALSKMLFTRLLFSALVDADYCSSAEHFEPDYMTQNTGAPLQPEIALHRLLEVQQQKKRSSTADISLNRLRNQLFEDCLSAAKHSPGLFTLTAPTGLGKTLSLFAFAAEHCRLHQKRRIILILPFLAIISQNIKDYRQIIPELLEIHSNSTSDPSLWQLRHRWDAPCIVTTNVGFFEPLFSADPGRCRHLHQIANSVIVLDEAQSLPPHLLDATLRTVNLLCEQYGCTVVFSTATQPAFAHRPNLIWCPREIVPNPASLFSATRRAVYDWRIDHPTPFSDIADELGAEPQSCVIVNLRKHARALFEELSARCGSESTFFLTTDLCPAHRSALLDEIQSRLKAGLSCHLVATQCIEAGVDLSFPTVYRALAPLDSIIQAAGRCNRNGSHPDGRVVVFLPEADALYPPGHFYEYGANCVRILHSRHPIDCSDLTHIQEYYHLLYSNAEGDKTALRQAVEAEDFAEVEKSYKIIESTGVQVIVPYSGALDLFRQVQALYDRQGLSNALLRLARPITVSCFDEKAVQRYCQRLSFRDPETRQDLPTSCYLLSIPEFYTDRQGLLWKEEAFDGLI